MGFIADKYFSDSIESISIKEHMDAIDLIIPDFSEEGDYNCEGKSLVGEINPTIKVLKQQDAKSPVIIHHHGLNEKPIEKSCEKIFLNKKYPIYANIILVQSSFRSSEKEYSDHMKYLSDFVVMIAASVCLTERLIERHHEVSESPVYVTGLDMGGFVANLHHAFFNSASVYIPILAGAGLGDMLFNSAFRKNISSLAKNNENKIINMLNFDDTFMSKGRHNNVFPLLSKSDQVFKYDRQKTCFGDIPIKVVNKGVLSGFSTGKDAAEHIIRVMERASRFKI